MLLNCSQQTVLMDVVLTNGATSLFEGKVCTLKQPNHPLAIDAKYRWPLLYLLQLPAGEGWRQDSANSFPLLILSHIDGGIQDPVQTKVLHRENITAKGTGLDKQTGEGFQPLSTQQKCKKIPTMECRLGP